MIPCKKRINIIIIILIFVSGSCGIFPGITSRKETIPLPGDTDIPGWRIGPSGEKRYSRENIGDFPGDKSGLYGKYGLVELAAAEYVRVDDPGRKIILEIYKMNSPLCAFGIFSHERNFTSGGTPGVCGDSYSGANSFFERKGEYYVRIYTEGGYKGSERDLAVFGNVVCDKLRVEEEPLPDYIALFADKNPGNLVYEPGSLPGLPELKGFFLRKRNIAGNDRIVFFSKRAGQNESHRELSKLMEPGNNGFLLLGTGEYQTAFREIPGKDCLVISVYNEWIFGVVSAGSIAEGKYITDVLYNELLEFIPVKR